MVSLDFPPTVGGISAHVYELSRALGDLGHRVCVITRQLPSQDDAFVKRESMEIYRLRLRWAAPLYGGQINRFIQTKLPEIQPDLIHVHGMAPLEGYKIKGVPLAYTNHTSGYLQRIQKGGFRRMALLRRLFAKPQLFLAPSRELLEMPFDIDATKVFIPNGVDANKYRFDAQARSETRSSLGVNDDQVLGILTRRLVPKNGVKYLARATRFLDDERLRLLLIGDGPEYAEVSACLEQHFANRFTMLGAKSHDEIIPYYSAADFSILPSLMEATSISGLEAMATSLPLVGTRVGGIPDLIDTGRNGFLCDPEDDEDLAMKITALLGVDLKAFGAHSREMVERGFAWPQIARETVKAYEELL
jgi:glycosyltransferase involved in cell wall biosynthesis